MPSVDSGAFRNPNRDLYVMSMSAKKQADKEARHAELPKENLWLEFQDPNYTSSADLVLACNFSQPFLRTQVDR
jgi:hypothetical protein